MEKLLEHMGDFSRSKIGFDLAVDVYEKEEKIFAEMHIPGIDPKKLDIEVDGELLKISGVREEKKEQNEKNFFSREIKYGSFERTVVLPKKVISDQTQASYAEGTLVVSMPIESISKRKKITVG